MIDLQLLVVMLLPVSSLVIVYLILRFDDIILYFEERDFNDYLAKTTKLPLKEARVSRIYFSLSVSLIVICAFLLNNNSSLSAEFLYLLLIAFASAYKLYYIHLRLSYNLKVKKLKTELPFFFKHLTYLLNAKPVDVALKESYQSSPRIIKDDLKELIDGSISSPSSIKPFESFASKYQEVENIKYYMYTLHLLKEVSSEEKGRLLLKSFTSNITKHTIESREVKMTNVTDTLQIVISLPVLVLGYLIFNLLSLYLDVIL